MTHQTKPPSRDHRATVLPTLGMVGVAALVTIMAFDRLEAIAVTQSSTQAAPTTLLWLLSTTLFTLTCLAVALPYGKGSGLLAASYPAAVASLAGPGVLGWVPTHPLDAKHSSADIVAWLTERVPPGTLLLTVGAACALTAMVLGLKQHPARH